jgi:DNA-binding MarR family transcriptional regulator
MCATVRRASRALTQHYEEALRPLGLRSSQFTLLQVLSRAGDVTQGDLGRMLAMDSTTLTRTLAIMARRGWIAKRRGNDRREWRFRLAPAGQLQFERALPHWQRVQQDLRQQLGAKRWDDYMKRTRDLTVAVTK